MRESKVAILRTVKVSFIVFLALFFALVLSNGYADDGNASDSGSGMQKRIQKLGAKPVLDQLYSNQDDWEKTLNLIDKGQLDWVKIGVELAKSADAGAKGELINSLSNALRKEPAQVLSLVSNDLIPSICTGMYDAGPWKQNESDALREIETLQEKLKKMKKLNNGRAQRQIRHLR